MTLRSSKRWQYFERDLVLGAFISGKPTAAPGEDKDDVNALLTDGQGSAKVAVVRDLRQDSLNGITGSRPEEDDRQAMERGEDEGMTVGRE